MTGGAATATVTAAARRLDLRRAPLADIHVRTHLASIGPYAATIGWPRA